MIKACALSSVVFCCLITPHVRAGLFDAVKTAVSDAVTGDSDISRFETMLGQSNPTPLIKFLCEEKRGTPEMYRLLKNLFSQRSEVFNTLGVCGAGDNGRRSANLTTVDAAFIAAVQAGVIQINNSDIVCFLQNKERPSGQSITLLKYWRGEPERLGKFLYEFGYNNYLKSAIALGKAKVSQEIAIKLGFFDGNAKLSYNLIQKIKKALVFYNGNSGIRSYMERSLDKITSPEGTEKLLKIKLRSDKEGVWVYEEHKREPGSYTPVNFTRTVNGKVVEKSVKYERRGSPSEEPYILQACEAIKTKTLPIEKIEEGDNHSPVNRSTTPRNLRGNRSRDTQRIKESFSWDEAFLLAIYGKDNAALDIVLDTYSGNTLPNPILLLWCSIENPNRISPEQEAMLAKCIQDAITKKKEMNLPLLMMGAHNLGNREILERLLEVGQECPKAFVEKAKDSAIAKELVQKALAKHIPILADFQEVEDLRGLFEGDEATLLALKAMEDSLRRIESSEVVFQTPLTARDGDLTSGDYYLNDKAVQLQSTLRIPKGETVRINLMGGCLDGADIVVAKGATLELYNGLMFPEQGRRTQGAERTIYEIRNFGSLTLSKICVGTTIINREDGTLTLKNSSVGSDVAITPPTMFLFWDNEKYREKAHPKLSKDENGGGIQNYGTLQTSELSTIYSLTNHGAAKLSHTACFFLTNQSKGKVESSGCAMYWTGNANEANLVLDKSICATITNSGQAKIRGAFVSLTNGKKNENSAVAELGDAELDEVLLGQIRKSKCTTNGDGDRLFVPIWAMGFVLKSKPNLSNCGILAFTGSWTRDWEEVTLVNGHFVGHALGAPEKPYTGGKIVFKSNYTALGVTLVRECYPEKFSPRLPKNRFAEKRPSAQAGLSDFIIVDESGNSTISADSPMFLDIVFGSIHRDQTKTVAVDERAFGIEVAEVQTTKDDRICAITLTKQYDNFDTPPARPSSDGRKNVNQIFNNAISKLKEIHKKEIKSRSATVLKQGECPNQENLTQAWGLRLESGVEYWVYTTHQSFNAWTTVKMMQQVDAGTQVGVAVDEKIALLRFQYEIVKQGTNQLPEYVQDRVYIRAIYTPLLKQ